jgi:hypothetical protein
MLSSVLGKEQSQMTIQQAYEILTTYTTDEEIAELGSLYDEALVVYNDAVFEGSPLAKAEGR